MMNWMTETYHKHSAADEYWFGFVVNHLLYVAMGLTFEEIARYFQLGHASSKRGGYAKVRIRAKAAQLRDLLPRSVLLGDESLLTEIANENKGNNFERVIVERYEGRKWVKDSTPFWVAGDATINGRQVQIKMNDAELTNEKTLRARFA